MCLQMRPQVADRAVRAVALRVVAAIAREYRRIASLQKAVKISRKVGKQRGYVMFSRSGGDSGMKTAHEEAIHNPPAA